MLKSNIYYFNFSQENQEDKLDEYYVFINSNINIQKFVDKIKEIKELLITIKVLINKNENSNKINEYFKYLFNSLDSYSNCSEFVCFANACDLSLIHIQKDFELLKRVTLLYLKHRTISDLTPSEWVQALIDSHSSRKKGNNGDMKVLDVFLKNNFYNCNSWDEFFDNEKSVVRFSKKDFDINTIRKKLNIKIENESQNKALDLLIKLKNQFYLLEAKHINVSGGGQDKQIKELIKNLSLSESNINVHYISFLDGKYSNLLLNDENTLKKGKVAEQYKEILKNLEKCQHNYWLNTAGLFEFIKDLK